MTGKVHKRPAIEWIFGALSGALVACLVLFLLYRAIAPASQEIRLAAVLERAEQTGNGTAIQVLVVNAGSDAVAEVTVAAISEDGQFAPRHITFDHLAANSVRRGVFLLPPDARMEGLRLEVTGYVIP